MFSQRTQENQASFRDSSYCLFRKLKTLSPFPSSSRAPILRAINPTVRRPFIYLFSLTLAVAAWPHSLRAQATIEGTVHLSRPRVEPASSQRYPGAPAAAIPGVSPAPAVVYLEGQFAAAASTNTPPVAQMGQKDARFIPPVLPVRTGTLV